MAVRRAVYTIYNVCIRWPRKVLKTLPTPSPAADASALACTAVMGLDFAERGIYIHTVAVI